MPAIANCQSAYDRSHAPRGNAMHPLTLRVTCCPAGRGASQAAFPRRAWERSTVNAYTLSSLTVEMRRDRDYKCRGWILTKPQGDTSWATLSFTSRQMTSKVTQAKKY
ncbi:hypothetical protein PflCFBP13517_05690 [Pseudomonas fluorescens]|nr:hypothetical protein PflCFBP13517_05690 [Pseudomonas fluorescens]